MKWHKTSSKDDLTSPEELEIDDVIGWVDTGDIWTILDRG